jgi:hypothetical protein
MCRRKLHAVCKTCGLQFFQHESERREGAVSYSIVEWARLCKRRSLDSGLVCLQAATPANNVAPKDDST